MRRLSPSVLVREELDRLVTDGVGRDENIISALVETATRLVVQQLLEAERSDFLGGRGRARRRDGDERGLRNGYVPSRLKMAEGPIEVRVPQVRDAEEPYRSSLMSFLDGNSDVFERLVTEMYARGLSTRDVEDAFRDATGELLLSRSAVSEVTDQLWRDYEAFITRDLSDISVEYLFCDAIFESLRRQSAKEAPGSAAALIDILTCSRFCCLSSVEIRRSAGGSGSVRTRSVRRSPAGSAGAADCRRPRCTRRWRSRAPGGSSSVAGRAARSASSTRTTPSSRCRMRRRLDKRYAICCGRPAGLHVVDTCRTGRRRLRRRRQQVAHVPFSHSAPYVAGDSHRRPVRFPVRLGQFHLRVYPQQWRRHPVDVGDIQLLHQQFHQLGSGTGFGCLCRHSGRPNPGFRAALCIWRATSRCAQRLTTKCDI